MDSSRSTPSKLAQSEVNEVSIFRSDREVMLAAVVEDINLRSLACQCKGDEYCVHADRRTFGVPPLAAHYLLARPVELPQLV